MLKSLLLESGTLLSLQARPWVLRSGAFVRVRHYFGAFLILSCFGLLGFLTLGVTRYTRLNRWRSFEETILRLHAQQLAEISEMTIRHYNENAQSFWDGTRDHDVSQNIGALTRALGPGAHRILDFGCGPGRDLITLKALGHEPFGLDGAIEFCELARRNAQCTVWHQDFLQLNLPKAFFDGIFANASLFHIPSQELPRVLSQLGTALRVGGVLFASNPRGDNVEGWHGLRYGAYYDHAQWSQFMTEAGFVEIEHYYRPAGKPREEQPWLASTWRC